MADDEQCILRKAVVLWEKPPISCTCRTLANGLVEICVASDDRVIRRQVFSDREDAARFAIAQMHAYSAS